MAGKVQIIAHRGASGSAPENTLAAFRKALDEERADALELDLRTTRDGHLVVIHDATVNRTSDGSGRVSRYTLDGLRALDFGSWFRPEFAGERILTLREFLEAFGERTWYMLDCKAADPDALATHLQEYKGRMRFLVAFDSLSKIRAFKDRVPSVPAAYTMTRRFALSRLAAAGCSAVHPRKNLLTEHFRDEARREALEVNVWTVNEPDDLRWVGSLHPDGIFTNFPGRARELLDSQPEG